MSKRREEGLHKKCRRELFVRLLAFCSLFIMILGSGVFVNTFLSNKSKVENQLSKISSLENELEQEKKRSEKLDRDKLKKNTDEYVEQVARDTLGLVKPDDIILQPEN